MTSECLNFIGPPSACPRQAPVPVGKAKAGSCHKESLNICCTLGEMLCQGIGDSAQHAIFHQLHVTATVIVDVLLAFVIVRSLIDNENCPDRVKFA